MAGVTIGGCVGAMAAAMVETEAIVVGGGVGGLRGASRREEELGATGDPKADCPVRRR